MTSEADVFLIGNADDTEAVGEAIGAALAEGPFVVALQGPLGAGKTTFVRGLARGLGVRTLVKSPSFTLHDQHKGRLVLDHFDAYFVRDPAELARNGLHEMLGEGHVAVIEWADRVASELPTDRLEISLAHVPEGRRVEVRALGPCAETIWRMARSRRAPPQP